MKIEVERESSWSVNRLVHSDNHDHHRQQQTQWQG